MTHEKAHKFVIGIIGLFLLFSFATCFSGCLTAKNLPKHNDKFPLAAAEYAAGKYPRRDSIGTPKLDSIKKADNVDYSFLIDSINQVVDSINTDWANAIDSATSEFGEAYREKLRADKKEIEGLKSVIAKLKAEYKPCKTEKEYYTADHFEVEGPAIAAAKLQAEKEKADKIKVIEQLTVTKDQMDEWRHLAHIRFWIITSLIFLLLLLFAIGVGKFLKKKSNPLL